MECSCLLPQTWKDFWISPSLYRPSPQVRQHFFWGYAWVNDSDEGWLQAETLGGAELMPQSLASSCHFSASEDSNSAACSDGLCSVCWYSFCLPKLRRISGLVHVKALASSSALEAAQPFHRTHPVFSVQLYTLVHCHPHLCAHSRSVFQLHALLFIHLPRHHERNEAKPWCWAGEEHRHSRLHSVPFKLLYPNCTLSSPAGLRNTNCLCWQLYAVVWFKN